MDDVRLLEIDINMIQTFIFDCISELIDDEKVGHLASRVYDDLDRLKFEMRKQLSKLREASAKDI